MRKFIMATLFLMCMLAAILILAITKSKAEVQSDSPGWLYTYCDTSGHVTVGWMNPSEDVLPFANRFSGYLTVYSTGWYETEILMYFGPSNCPLYPGCVVYTWRASYEIPPDDYYIDAYIVNADDNEFDVVPMHFSPGCSSALDVNIYVPMVVGNEPYPGP